MLLDSLSYVFIVGSNVFIVGSNVFIVGSNVFIVGSNAGQTTFRGRVEGYWLPNPLACYPLTSPPVRRSVPSDFNWTLPPGGYVGRSTRLEI